MNMHSFQGKTMNTHYSRTKGFTLIELMVALLLGILLMGGVISVFIEGKRNFVQDDEVSRVQENGRYALRLLSREIAMAGFFGGVPDTSSVDGGAIGTDCGAGGNWLLDGAAPMEVIDNSDNSTDTYYSCFADGDIVAGTDLVTVKRASDLPLIKNGEWQSGLTALVDTRYYLHNENRGLGAVELKLGADYTDIGTIATAANGSGVWEYFASIFYIALDNDGIPNLCKKEIVSTGVGISAQRCLVGGIEDLQLELGMDLDADGFADQFISNDTNPPVAGAEIVDDIVSVRIHLLARSINEINNFPAASRSYRLGGGTTVVTPVDQFYRMVFSGTVVIRNPTSQVLN